jgi:hypothetical protein
VNPWPDFISTLIWQLIVLGVLFAFREQLKALLGRIATLKVGDTEMTFQEPADDAEKAGESVEVKVRTIGPGGFLTAEGVGQLVSESDVLEPTEDVCETFLLFRTGKQRTWLVATSKSLLCILDDENTRSRGRLIQWRLPLSATEPIHAREHKAGSGLIDIGPRKRWYYSTTLHPDPKELERDVESLIRRAGEKLPS